MVGQGRCSYGMEGGYDLKQREYQMVTFTGGPMNIADNPSHTWVSLGGNYVSNTTEYYLGAMLAYLEIRISDTFGWPLGMS